MDERKERSGPRRNLWNINGCENQVQSEERMQRRQKQTRQMYNKTYEGAKEKKPRGV